MMQAEKGLGLQPSYWPQKLLGPIFRQSCLLLLLWNWYTISL